MMKTVPENFMWLHIECPAATDAALSTEADWAFLMAYVHISHKKKKKY